MTVILYNMKKHDGKMRLVEIWYPLERQGTQRLQEVIRKRWKPEIRTQRRRTKAQEEMQTISRRTRSLRGD